MTMATQMSLTGFIASTPEVHLTRTGKECFRARVGVEHFRKEVDGSFTPLENTYHDLVMFEATARNAYQRFRSGDSFIASGYIHEYEVDRGAGSVICEEFVARKIGHDINLTRYEVRRRRPTPPTVPPAVTSADSAAVGL